MDDALRSLQLPIREAESNGRAVPCKTLALVEAETSETSGG